MQNIVRPIQGRGRPRKFQVPETFSCLGHMITVNIVPESQIAGDLLGTSEENPNGYRGYYDHELKQIYLADTVYGSGFEQSFLHELMHCLLYHAGYDELSEDEVLVDMLAELFYQFIVTKKGYINFEPREKNQDGETLDSRGN